MKGPVVLAALLAGAACSSLPRLTFTPSAPGAAAPGRPGTCEIEVFRDRKPERPHTELGVINYHVERHRLADGGMSLEAALPRIKARACEAGADAVFVRVVEERRLEFALFHVTAIALQFRP